jgi:hypothetical protein
MSIPRAQYLLMTFVSLLAARGLAPESLDPWHAWLTFKQFARQVAEDPDPGVSVQLMSTSSGDVRLYLLRQVSEVEENGRLEPLGGVICELDFASPVRRPSDWEVWSFDHSSFDRFVDAVEQHGAFADLLVDKPTSTDVYWEDADG